MTGRVVLHIGAMKSGTSYLQSSIYANRQALVEQGVVPAGESWGAQIAAAVGIRGLGQTMTGDDTAGAWERLVRECREREGTSLISVELLARLRKPRVRQIAADFAGMHVDVVLTLRDLNRTIPAMWQETVQNGRTWDWDTYVAAVRDSRATRRDSPWRSRPDNSIERAFWANHDAAAIVERWAAVATDGRVKVVTVPRPGEAPGLLLDRFAEAVGFDASGFVDAARTNSSLGVLSTEALRLLNLELNARGRVFPYAMYLRKRVLAKRLMVTRASAEPRIAFPVPSWVGRTSRRQVRQLKRSGVRLYGDWKDLRPVPLTTGVDPMRVSPADVADAMRDGYRMFRAHLEERRPVIGLPPVWAGDGGPEAVLRDGAAALADLIEAGEAHDG